MVKCQYLRIRTKNYLKYTYCTHFKTPTSTNECSVCELYSHKQMFVKTPKNTLKKQVSKKKYKNKQKLSDSKRFSILTDDLTRCIECGLPKTHLHELYFGQYREKSKVFGCVIPMCLNHHLEIHKNRSLNLKYKKLGQQAFIDTYNLTTDDFIKVFGKNYLD